MTPRRALSPGRSERRKSAPGCGGTGRRAGSLRSHHQVDETAATVAPIERRRLHFAGRAYVWYPHRADHLAHLAGLIARDRHRFDLPRDSIEELAKLARVPHRRYMHRPEPRRKFERIRAPLENHGPLEPASLEQLDLIARDSTPACALAHSADFDRVAQRDSRRRHRLTKTFERRRDTHGDFARGASFRTHHQHLVEREAAELLKQGDITREQSSNVADSRSIDHRGTHPAAETNYVRPAA